MDRSYEVTDSSDWLNTPVAPLGSVEVALRCQVCKDFFNTPMITSCSHTFCSLCIRRCLTNDGKCPSCRSSDQELRLRRNWAIEELVDAFQAARPSILKLGQDLLDARTNGNNQTHKRKLDDTDIRGNEQLTASQRKTRSQGQRSHNRDIEHDGATTNQLDNADAELDDDLSACPICNRRMKEEDVFQHLDTHQEDDRRTPTRKAQHTLASTTKLISRSAISSKPPERLPSLSYSIMNENALRKKITSLGIPGWGSKQLLVRRHTEWVNLWNANCDSSRPRNKRELLSDLDSWERTQGGLAPNTSTLLNGPNAVMRKDFDREAWAANHGDDFQQLAARARQKMSTCTVPGSSTTQYQLDRSSHKDASRSISAGDYDASGNEQTGASAEVKASSPTSNSVQSPPIDLSGDDAVK